MGTFHSVRRHRLRWHARKLAYLLSSLVRTHLLTVLNAEEVVADSIAACRSARVVFNPHVGLRLHYRNGLGRLLLEDLAEFLLVLLLGELNDVAFDADKIRLGGLVRIDACEHFI